MEISVQLPLDSDGFVRRECPHCLQQFKWHFGPANEEAEHYPNPVTYYCPFCGQPAGPDSWWTREQINYAEGLAAPAAAREMQHELERVFKQIDNEYFTIKMTGRLDVPSQPMPLTEADDMVIVVSPCHAYEAMKVSESQRTTFHCLICGEAFAL
jgi:hypothetical protein